ncbi:MAG: restriction endonuclease subunit S [Candidatus Cloacimonetes bacterium]|nr:restriction endonuclease subunit S [Candidatus Cloacimonadota bacterium]
MRRNINDAINSFYLPKNISYQIIINLLILKTLSKKEFYYGLDFRRLWDNLINSIEKKEYFIYEYLPSLQNNKTIDHNLSLVFKNMHIPFTDIDDSAFRKFVDIVEYFENEDIIEFIANLSNDFKLGYLKTLDVQIQKNIIRLLDIKLDDKVLDLNLAGSNFLSLLGNDSHNNVGFIQSYNDLPLRYLELLLSDNTHVDLIQNNPLIEYNSKLNNKFDVVFAIPPFGQRISKWDCDVDFPIQATMSHNLYIQKALNSLTYDGKCALIVPDSFLNQTNKESDSARRYIFDKLVCVINLGAVFKPYAGVNVSLLILKNDNYNNEILMVNFQDNKQFPIDDFSKFVDNVEACRFELDRLDLDDIKNSILVSKEEILQNNYILDFKRYQPLEEIITPIQHPEELIKKVEVGAKLLLESISNIKKVRNNLAHGQISLQTFQLDQIASIRLGKPLPKDNIENGEIPFVNITDITRCTTDYIDSSEVMISEDFAYQNNLTIVEANTILLSVRGTIGKVILAGSKIAISPTLVAIEVDINKAKPYFVYQWFLNKKEYFEANAVGATIASLSTAFIKELKIDLPPIETQNQFEEYKNDLDNIKQTLSKLNDENQNLSKSIFNQFY